MFLKISLMLLVLYFKLFKLFKLLFLNFSFLPQSILLNYIHYSIFQYLQGHIKNQLQLSLIQLQHYYYSKTNNLLQQYFIDNFKQKNYFFKLLVDLCCHSLELNLNFMVFCLLTNWGYLLIKNLYIDFKLLLNLCNTKPYYPILPAHKYHIGSFQQMAEANPQRLIYKYH